MSTKKTPGRKPIPLAEKDLESRKKYVQANHKQLGDLHERMKWLVGCKESLREYTHGTKDRELFTLVQALGFAVLDLENELSFHEPAKPAYARRNPTGLHLPEIQHHKNPTAKEALAPKPGKSRKSATKG